MGLSTEFIKCKLCKKNFLIVKKAGVPMEKICYDCIGVPEQSIFFYKREVKIIQEVILVTS